MTAQKSKNTVPRLVLTGLTEYQFKEAYSRFKIWFGTSSPDGYNPMFYAYESSHTISQMRFGRVEEIIIDAQKGFNNCLKLEEKRRGGYNLARIFLRKSNAPDPNDPWVKMIEFDSKGNIIFQKPISFINSAMYYTVHKNGNELWLQKTGRFALKTPPVEIIKNPATPRIANDPQGEGLNMNELLHKYQ